MADGQNAAVCSLLADSDLVTMVIAQERTPSSTKRIKSRNRVHVHAPSNKPSLAIAAHQFLNAMLLMT